jgi:hypothetical protein
MCAASCLVFRIEAEVNEGVVTLTSLHNDVATPAAITAGRTSAGDKLFTAKGNDAISAVAGLYPDSCLIDKHGSSFDSKRWPWFFANVRCAGTPVGRPKLPVIDYDSKWQPRSKARHLLRAIEFDFVHHELSLPSYLVYIVNEKILLV